MPRTARVIFPGLPHHITQGGNNRLEVFFTAADRRAYLAWLREYALACRLDILGYCLMPTHLHLLAIPHEASSLAEVLGRTHLRYTQLINARLGRTGHLWQGRYQSCALDAGYLTTVLRYIERNPVRAGLVEEAWEFPWSSAAAHVGLAPEEDLLPLAPVTEPWDHTLWRERLRMPDNPEDLLRIRLHTSRGRPLGEDAFLRRLEAATGARFVPQRVGRPKTRTGDPREHV